MFFLLKVNIYVIGNNIYQMFWTL